MTAAELFTRYGATWNPRVAVALGVVLDEIEGKLDKLREAHGLGPDWLPIHAREQSAPPHASVKWEDKARGCNGFGDLNTFLGELAHGMDVINAKVEELVREGEMVTEIAAPRRGPGRPRKDAA